MEFRAVRLAAATAITLLTGAGLTPQAGAASGIRLTELLAAPSGATAPVVEVTNLGYVAVDLGDWRLRVGDAVHVVSAPTVLAPGDVLRLVARDGIDEPGLRHVGPAFPVPAEAGSAALFRPGSDWGPSTLADFVQWGGSGQPLAATAVESGLWAPGRYCPPFVPGFSLQYCGPSAGPEPWVQGHPTPGKVNGCLFATPVRTGTWGALKSRFRD